MRSAIILISIGLAPFVSAHCKITAATGDAGGKGTALGITAGSGNSQSDVTIFNKQITAAGFGKTTKGGKVSPDTAVPAAMKIAGSNTLPQVSAGGSVQMTIHQVNGDGAGPMACAVSTDATGQTWQNIQVTANIPGTKGRSNANNKDFPLTAQLPANMACTGQVAGMSGVCMVKCQNPVGPFGGTVAVQMAGGNANAATGTTATGNTGSTKANGANGANGAKAATGSTAANKKANNKNSNNDNNNKRAEDVSKDDADCDMSTHEDATKSTKREAAPEPEPAPASEDTSKDDADCDMTTHEDATKGGKRSIGRPVAVRRFLESPVSLKY